MENSWLHSYYNKVQDDYKSSLTRRDTITTWSYSLLAAILGIYFGFFSESLSIPQFWRFVLVIGLTIILVRFFFQSMIAYGFILRWRILKTEIEKHWMNETPTLDELKKNISEYDHGKKLPKSGRNRLVGQIRSGFVLILVIPLILIANEFFIQSEVSLIYFGLLGGLAVYVVLEVINFVTYDQMKK